MSGSRQTPSLRMRYLIRLELFPSHVLLPDDFCLLVRNYVFWDSGMASTWSTTYCQAKRIQSKSFIWSSQSRSSKARKKCGLKACSCMFRSIQISWTSVQSSRFFLTPAMISGRRFNNVSRDAEKNCLGCSVAGCEQVHKGPLSNPFIVVQNGWSCVKGLNRHPTPSTHTWRWFVFAPSRPRSAAGG